MPINPAQIDDRAASAPTPLVRPRPRRPERLEDYYRPIGIAAVVAAVMAMHAVPLQRQAASAAAGSPDGADRNASFL